ncbi:MAG: hypothetical protein ACWGQW_21690 [bacterium]
MKLILMIAAILAVIMIPIAASAQFGADVGFSKTWVEKNGKVESADGAVPGITFTHVFATELYQGREVPQRGLTFGYANFTSASVDGSSNRVFGQYFYHYRGMNAAIGVQADFLESNASELITTTTSVLGPKFALQFPSFVADRLPFEASGAVGWDLHGDNVLVSTLFLGFNGSLE